MNKRMLSFALILAILLTVLSGCGKPAAASDTQTQTLTESASVPEQAPVRKVREGIQTILVLCLNEYDIIGTSGYRNNSKADFMLMLVVDELQGKITPVQFNPDTLVSFSAPGMPQEPDMPIGTVYSYGSGGSDSCLNVIKSVSGLLGGVDVDHYLTFTMDSIGIVTDMIGGVSVPAQTAVSDSEEPETVLISGKEAVSFFADRDADDTANEVRMERQRQFMNGLYPPFMAKAKNEDFLTKLSLRLGDKMNTSLTLSQLILMFETLAKYNMEPEITVLPGEAKNIDGVHQFSIDQAAVDAIVDQLICG